MAKSNETTLLLSVGPHQLIAEYILAKQLGFTKTSNIKVLRLHAPSDGNVPNKLLDKAEKFILNILDIKNRCKTGSLYKVWGNGPFQKFFNLFIIRKKIKKHLFSLGCDSSEVTNVIMAARKDIGELLLLSSFKNLKKVYFVSDGNPTYYDNYFVNPQPFYFKLIGVKNYYKNKEIYFFDENKPVKENNVVVKILNKKHVNDVFNKFYTNKEIDHWLSASFQNVKINNVSIVFMYPLLKADNDINLRLYKSLILNEINKNKNNNIIILKQHPREMINKLENFKEELVHELDEYKNKFFFFDNSYFSRLPIELYVKKLNLNKVITIVSSSVFFIKKENIEVYTSKNLPKNFNNTAIKLAKDYGLKVNIV